MEKNDTWHNLEIATKHLSPVQNDGLQIPSSCTWCGAPGKHPHRVRVEGPGLSQNLRDITLEVMLCPACYKSQKMIDISGWAIMVGAMILYVAQSAVFRESIAGAANAIFIVLLFGAFLLASWRWRVARMRRGFSLKPSDSAELLLSVHSADWLEEFERSNPV